MSSLTERKMPVGRSGSWENLDGLDEEENMEDEGWYFGPPFGFLLFFAILAIGFIVFVLWIAHDMGIGLGDIWNG